MNLTFMGLLQVKWGEAEWCVSNEKRPVPSPTRAFFQPLPVKLFDLLIFREPVMEDYNSAGGYESDQSDYCGDITRELHRLQRYAARLEVHCRHHKWRQGILRAQITELEEDMITAKVCVPSLSICPPDTCCL